MKICILGDTHFGMRNDSLDFHKYIEKFYKNTFFPYLKLNGITTVVQLGDLFDRRKYINFNSLYLCRKFFFDQLRENNITFITLLGNHDVAYKNTLQVNSSELLLKEYDNITVYNSFSTVNFGGIDIDIVPWLCDDNESEILSQIKQSRSQICFGHFELAGFEIQPGIVHHEGLDRALLNKYDVVLTGHYHHKSTDGSITYVGTPYEMFWSDYNDPRGFHIFDTDTRELEFIQNPYRMFYKLNYKDDLEHFAEGYTSSCMDYSIYEGSYVKVVVLTKLNPFLFDIVIDNLYKAGAADISVVEDFTEIENNADEELVDRAEDTMTILSKYIDNLTLNVESDKLKKVVQELYVEALNTETE
jgi:DNA repair exonuclease SbcCD nuclease subunit